MNINKALMRRYYLVQKAKDAEIIGIVVGTLGIGINPTFPSVFLLCGRRGLIFLSLYLSLPLLYSGIP